MPSMRRSDADDCRQGGRDNRSDGPGPERPVGFAVRRQGTALSHQDDHIDSRLRPLGRTPAWLADPIVQALAFIVLVSLLFLTFPGIDPWFTGLFYDPQTGFPMSRLAAFTTLRSLTSGLLGGAVTVLIAAIVIKIARPMRPTPIRPCDIVFLLSTLVIGPGVIVNVFFKEFWGRPRPGAVELFGGESPFVTVWQISDYCLSNCSFVSGEAAAAIWLVAIAIVLPARWRRVGLLVVLPLAALLSLNRVAFGRHFLSDVLLAWGITVLVIAVMHRIIVERPPAWLKNDRLEDGLTRLGKRLRQGLIRG